VAAEPVTVYSINLFIGTTITGAVMVIYIIYYVVEGIILYGVHCNWLCRHFEPSSSKGNHRRARRAGCQYNSPVAHGRNSVDNHACMMTHTKKYKICAKRKVNAREALRRTGLESGR
jgi:hypothetical protein